MRAYIDSDALIWHLRGNGKALRFFRDIRDAGEYELWIGAMQRAEIVFFMRPEEEAATRALLSQFSTALVNQTIVDRAAALYRKWHPSHGVDINDSILAATAMETGGAIFCLNTRHYPMPEVVARKAW